MKKYLEVNDLQNKPRQEAQKTNYPVIDVIIPCYNQGYFLAEAIESVLNQTYPHFNITVVNDGSTDTTRKVAKIYKNKINYIEQENSGVSAARNTGILNTNGDFLLFLDADDLLDSQALEKYADAVIGAPDGVIFYGQYKMIDLENNLLGQYNLEPSYDTDIVDTFHILITEFCLLVQALIIRRSAILNIGLFDKSLTRQEDWDLILRLAAAENKFVSVTGAFSIYRRHCNGASANYKQMVLAGLVVLKKAMKYHQNCNVCHKLFSSITGEWRSRYFQLVKRELKEHISHREMHIVLIKIIQEILNYPFIVDEMSKSTSRYFKRKVIG